MGGTEMVDKKRVRRLEVRAENPKGLCGKIEHMTIDELKEIGVGDSVDGRCPACGMFPLTRNDIEMLEGVNIPEPEYYLEIKDKAEES